jgi:hypothetical protein
MLPDPSPFTTLSGTIVTMRKIVGVVGACLVVLGFLGSILALSTERLATWWFLLPAVLAIPAGFVLLWEAQVTWPRDGSPYPWQRRGAGGLVALLTIVVVVTIHGALRATLPDNWMADTLAQVIGISVGLILFKRLRQLMSRRLYDGNSRPVDRPR